MIGKIAPNGKSARGLASYLMRYGRGRIIAGTMAGRTPRELSREFGALRSLNPKLTKAVAHLMLSPAPGDPTLSDAQWQEIAQRYAEGMGYAKTAWCGLVHNDTDHQHLHIIACRIDIHGKTISDANSYRKSEAIVRRLERDFGLVAVASPTSIKRRTAATAETINEGEPSMQKNDPQATIPPNPFQPGDPQHATWPIPFEPGRDAAQLAFIEANPEVVIPSAKPGYALAPDLDKALRRALVEPAYENQMRAIFGDELTRVYRHGSGVTLYFRSPWRIQDSGSKLRVMDYKASEAAQAAASIVKMAASPPKCWKSITFTGSDAFVTCAMREARNHGIEIIAVGDTQLQILATVMSEGRGDMGSMVGFAAAPEPDGDPVLAPLLELDSLPPQPWPKLPVKEIFSKPVIPVPVPKPTPQPVVGVLPTIPNLRERLQARRQSVAPKKPTGPAPVVPKRPGLPGG